MKQTIFDNQRTVRQRLKPSGYRKATPAKGADDTYNSRFSSAFSALSSWQSHGFSLRRLWSQITLMLLLMLVGCSNAGGASSSIQILGPRSADDVVREFLGAWNSQNYSAMYNLLSPQSREVVAADEFVVTYEDTTAVLGLTGVGFEVYEAQEQGQSAAVPYDVTLQSSVFGEVQDAGRTMRLVQSPDGWRVAWSTMDIFNVLAPGSRIVVDAERLPRGNIYDRNGNVLVEQDGTVITLYAIREQMVNEVDCAVLLGDILQKQPDEILEYFEPYAPETLFYVGEVDPETERQHDAQLTEFCSIVPDFRIERQTRRYVGHGAASHVTGYIGTIPADQLETYLSQGYRESDLVGLAGIEQAYDAQLGGQASQTLRIVESGGVTLRELAGAEGIEPQDVTLTIDRDLQLATAKAISDAYNYALNNWGSLSPGTGAVVIDVNTGAILALASYPTFEPAIFNPDTPFPFVGNYIAELATDDMRPLTNRVVSEQFSPGSVFKIITTAASASENIFRPDEIFYCGLEWDGTAFGDSFGIRTDWRLIDGLDATGDITISQALTSSCDPFFYQAGALLYSREPGLVVEYAQRFGLGRRTGLSILGNEASGNVPMPGSAAEAINNAIGQGDTQLTVIQTAVMTAAVANGGTIYSPYIVERVGDEQVGQPTAVGDVGLSEAVLNIVRRGMCDVVNDTTYGTAWFVFPAEETNYSVCGKTGTSQTARREPHAWFVAYAPAENPEIAIVVVSEHSREGSEVAAPIVRRILDNYFGQPFLPFPEWWTGEYIPLTIPEGGTGGG